MRIKIFIFCLMAVGLFLTSCNLLVTPPNSSDIPETDARNNISKPHNTSGYTEDSISQSDNTLDSLDEKIIEYTLVVAQYFREPIETSVGFKNHPSLYEFLVNSIYRLYKEKIITLEDISGKDWYKEFLIPNEYLKKAAKLFLDFNTDLPDIFYTIPDFKYVSNEDAFHYSPFSPPMFITRSKGMVQNEDGTFSIIVAISKIEETDTIENIYTFKKINDPEWGELY